MGNQIRTSKYTVLTFIPKNLYYQFSKLANIYFLLMMILQVLFLINIIKIDDTTDYHNRGITHYCSPLIFVLFVSALKDIFEDMKRHKSDSFENAREVRSFDKKGKRFFVDKWRNLKVGEIVQIKSDQYFPADLVIIKSSNPNGICYIETKNLDGETNLKHKQAIKEVQA